MPLGTLPSLATLPDLSSTLKTIGTGISEGVQNAATLLGVSGDIKNITGDIKNITGTSLGNVFSVKGIVIVIGIVFVILGLITLTKVHQPIIAAGKQAAKKGVEVLAAA